MQPFLRRAVERGPLGICIRGACREAGFGANTSNNNSSSGSGDQKSSSSSSGGGHSAFWWRLVLLPLVHSLGNPMLSEKALQTLLQRLRGDPPPVKPQQAPQRIEAKRAKAHAKAAAIAAAKGRELPSKCTRGDPSRTNAGAAAAERSSKHNSNGGNSSNSSGLRGINDDASVGSIAIVASAPTSGHQSWPRDGWLELRKEWGCYLERGDLYLLKQTLTPSGGSVKAGNTRKGSNGDSDTSNEGHVAPGTRLPLPSLSAVLAAAAKVEADGYGAVGTEAAPEGRSSTKWSAGGPRAEVQGPVVQWGPWRIQAVVGLVRDSSESDASGASSQAPSEPPAAPVASLANGFVWLADGIEWTRTNTQTKQAALLPLQELPTLAAPLLGDLSTSSDSSIPGATASSSSKRAAEKASESVAVANVMPSMSTLLTGSMKYTMLMPMPRHITRNASRGNGRVGDDSGDRQNRTEGSDWDWSLELQPDAKLLPLRNLDRTFRKLVPLVAPVPKVSDSSSNGGAAAAESIVGNVDDAPDVEKAVAHCYVEVRYTFSD